MFSALFRDCFEFILSFYYVSFSFILRLPAGKGRLNFTQIAGAILFKSALSKQKIHYNISKKQNQNSLLLF